MKILHSWIEELLQTSLDPVRISDVLTMTGLEVESMEKIESVKGGLKGLVSGKVLECIPHPQADRLKITKVLVGNGEVLQIVCGAGNVETGQCVIVALPGTTIYPIKGEKLTIKKARIRGVDSYGMICAEDEIGWGENHEGILVLDREYEPGTPADRIFPVFRDVLYEIGLTPNRGDAASHLGIARELKAWINIHEQKNLRIHLSYPPELPEASGTLRASVEILHPELCRRYAGVVISGIHPKPVLPLMSFRLKACGFSPVHPVVDITNYVMLETGQPLHAFDFEKIAGKKIVVGTPEQPLDFRLLDGKQITLTEKDLVIGDEEKPLCLAGIYGGRESGISDATRVVFLESAYFDPGTIRKSLARHKIRTESSFRFERGTDIEIVIPSLHRASGLILEVCGGNISWGPEDHYVLKKEPVKIAFSFSFCNDLLGYEIPREDIRTILESMDIQIEASGKDGALCEIPSCKSDVVRPVDLVEEIGRMYGYERMEPSSLVKFSPVNHGESYRSRIQQQLQYFFVHRGFQEVMGLSLEKLSWHTDSPEHVIRLLNPVSNESAFLRNHLNFGAMQILSFNIRRQQRDLRFFEWGEIFSKEKRKTDDNGKGEEGFATETPEFCYVEKPVLGIYTAGRIFPMNHYGLHFSTALSDHLSLWYKLGEQYGKTIQVREYSDDFITGVQGMIENDVFGYAGYPSPALRKMFDLDENIPVCLSQLFYMKLFHGFSGDIHYREISPYPFVRRDLSFMVDKSMRYAELKEILHREFRDSRWKEMNLFDIYEGKNIQEGKKSLAVSFKFQADDATLKDEEIDECMKKIIKILQDKAGAVIRD